jgi:hypothetical protein
MAMSFSFAHVWGERTIPQHQNKVDLSSYGTAQKYSVSPSKIPDAPYFFPQMIMKN